MSLKKRTPKKELLKKGVTVTWGSIRRVLRKDGYSFRRARRVTARPPSAHRQARAQRVLSGLHQQETAGQCQVLYADESGFCLSPVVPYLWQKKTKKGEKDQTVRPLAQSHAERINVLGFLTRQNTLYNFCHSGRMTAQFLVDSIDALVPSLTGPTVLVLDNSTVHRANLVKAKRGEWRRKGLRLLFLPPYCPHLNLIEVLWRMMKYHWLAPGDYRDFATLCQSVKDILNQFGTKYRISFA